jgi:hypothetical protein
MTQLPYAATSTIAPRQRDCSLTLTFGDEELALSYDDAIEFKLEIGYIEENRQVTQRAVQSFNDLWIAKFAPIHNGFSIEFKESTRLMGRLALQGGHAQDFSARLQLFITEAGQQS